MILTSFQNIAGVAMPYAKCINWVNDRTYLDHLYNPLHSHSGADIAYLVQLIQEDALVVLQEHCGEITYMLGRGVNCGKQYYFSYKLIINAS
jgi:hypothetical protein